MLLVIKQKWNLILKQNEDFELIPANDSEWWNVRILKGDYTETVFRFGSIAIVEEKDQMSFDFEIVSSPIEGLVEEDCQDVVSKILEAVMIDAIKKKVKNE